ncbi:MAG: hypothetical protein M1814_002526 [Vezdaea aestivalis]|nr:MAG: hypothetical protein M1814_002526 [Vezdaea aestivalis]
MPSQHRKRPPSRWSLKGDKRSHDSYEERNVTPTPKGSLGGDSFSLVDTARNTRFTAGLRKAAEAPVANSNLRFKRIAFVSAGDYNVNDLLVTPVLQQSILPPRNTEVRNKPETTRSISTNEAPLIPGLEADPQHSDIDILNANKHQVSENVTLNIESHEFFSSRSPSPSVSDSNGGVALYEYEPYRQPLDTPNKASVDAECQSQDGAAEDEVITEGLSSMRLNDQQDHIVPSLEQEPTRKTSATAYFVDNDEYTSLPGHIRQAGLESKGQGILNDIESTHYNPRVHADSTSYRILGEIEMVLSRREIDGIVQYLTNFVGEGIEKAQWRSEEILLAAHHHNSREIRLFNQTDTSPYTWLKNIDEEVFVPSHLEGPDYEHHLDVMSDEGDQYYDILLPNRERPGLPHGKRQEQPNFPDGYFDAHLAEMWHKDRLVKAEKKREREVLRAQGLLSPKNGRKQSKGPLADLSAKYSGPVREDALKMEIHKFISSDFQQLSLPPMESPQRRSIHTFANRVGLTSKSKGADRNRYITLFKTKKTLDPLESSWDFFQVLSPKPRPGARRGQKDSAPRTFTKRGVAHHQDGDIVGAAAPRLGAENRGHAMMEKMGWSAGKALGTAENQGILDPLSHVVKLSKAGIQ